MRKQLSEKLKEAVASVVPVTLIVLLLQIITPMPTNMLIAFLYGAVMLVLGMGLFSLGADIAMMPMGERIGAHIIKSKHYLVLIPCGVMIRRAYYRCRTGSAGFLRISLKRLIDGQLFLRLRQASARSLCLHL